MTRMQQQQERKKIKKNKEQGENSPMIVTAGETPGNKKYGNKSSQIPDRDHSDSI